MIEQEFFKTFGIEEYRVCNHQRQHGFCAMGKGCDNHSCKENKGYPPITPEIVLKLEEVLFNINCSGVHMSRCLGHHKSENGMTHCHFEWGYEAFDLGDYFESEDKTYNDWHYESQNKDRTKALLSICIQLKDEIQEQVKAVFNEQLRKNNLSNISR